MLPRALQELRLQQSNSEIIASVQLCHAGRLKQQTRETNHASLLKLRDLELQVVANFFPTVDAINHIDCLTACYDCEVNVSVRAAGTLRRKRSHEGSDGIIVLEQSE